MSTPKTNIIILLGGGLLAANVALDPSFTPLRSDVTSGSASAALTGSPAKLVLVGLLTLIAMTVIADDNDSAANTMLVALAALWVLWLAAYKNPTKAPAAAASTPASAPAGSKQGKGKNA